jgi:proline dehydrogenase
MTFARDAGVGKERFEFQMLYGLRKGRWAELVRDGYRVRIYVPYGTHWIPYFYRRLREKKENVFFVMRNFFGG